MEYNPDNVYELTTKLCEKFATKLNGSPYKNVRRLRRKCYEILLSKHDKVIQGPKACLEDNKDPFCHLLAWKYKLINQHNKKHAEKLQQCLQKLEEVYSSDNKGLRDVLFLLLQLRRMPNGNDNISETSVTNSFRLQIDDQEPLLRGSSFIWKLDEGIFKLPSAISCCDSKYSNDSYQLRPEKSSSTPRDLSKKESSSVCVLYRQKTNYFECPSQQNEKAKNNDEDDDGYGSLPKTRDDIWEIALKTDLVDNRTWESFGKPYPNKELPFLSELENYGVFTDYKVALSNACTFDAALPKIKTQDHMCFTRDVKYMLVGIVSKTFPLGEHERFYLNCNVSLPILTPSTLKLYVEDLTFCGTCYRALSKFITLNGCNGLYRQQGYIFGELCDSIKRYLSFYRYTILSLPDNVSLLLLHSRIRKLKEHLSTLASLCKVGPYKDQSTQIPHGIQLLNYVYKKVLSITNENILMILYSVLYPCCQVYFSRYLQQWILEGTLSGFGDEFFIKPNMKYISTRGRTFWTRGYILDESNIPDFLSDIKTDILNCGKAMNLLRMCVPNSPLQQYVLSKKVSLISCCFTSEQLIDLEQNVAKHNLELSAACAPVFCLADTVPDTKEWNPEIFELMAKKKLATLKRIELERRKKLEEEMEKKAEAMVLLKEQYDMALLQKEKRMLKEIQRDIAYAEKDLEIERIRNKLIAEEAQSLITYYTELSEISDKRYKKITEHNIHLKEELLPPDPEQKSVTAAESNPEITLPIEDDTKSLSKSVSAETFSTAMETSDSECVTAEENTELRSSKSMDVLNANLEEQPQKEANENFLMAQENFKAALRNKAKVMNLELGIDIKYAPKVRTKYGLHDNATLTDAQKNKLKVMSSEFGIEIKESLFDKNFGRTKTILELNKEKVMMSSECFYGNTNCDNANYLNQNLSTDTPETKNKELSLPLPTEAPKPANNELQKPTPMSVDSTPLSEFPSTPSTSKFWQFLAHNEIPSTATTNFTEEGFNFKTDKKDEYVPCSSVYSRKSKRMASEDVKNIRINCLHLFLQQSVSVPLLIQTRLVNSELLKYFIKDLQYLKHLNSLRDYFFLQDGEFGRNITEGLFEKLYDVNFPIDLINFKTLQLLVHKALNSSSKCQANSDRLSFKINNLPKTFDLGNLNVLDCLSLSYKIEWPLNVLLPSDTLAKYDEVFKYLLKLHRVSWVQKKIFQELKILSKEVGRNQMYLMSSPQYRKIHQCRHVMSHFIQTFQNYIIGEVLHCNWEIFTRNLKTVTNLDQLYAVHTSYVKNILFMCLLNHKAAPIRKVLEKIFIVILKFYDYLRSQTWTIEDGHYVHPNFTKLENIFSNFEEFVMYLFKVGRKIVKTGYQPYLVQLLDMLDINAYYDQRNNAVSSC